MVKKKGRLYMEKPNRHSEDNEYTVIRHFENKVTEEEMLKRVISRHMSLQYTKQEEQR